MDARQDALEAYDLAQARVKRCRTQWANAGGPFTLKQPNGMTGGHPLWKALLEAETHADRLRARVLTRTTTGRPPGAASAPDRQPPQRVKLKVVP